MITVLSVFVLILGIVTGKSFYGSNGSGGKGGDIGGYGGNDEHKDYPHHYPKYKFEYGVKDLKTGDHKDVWESRDGDKVFSLLLTKIYFKNIHFYFIKKISLGQRKLFFR